MTTISSLRRLDLYRQHSPALLTFAVVANLLVATLIWREAPGIAIGFAGMTIAVCARRSLSLRRSNQTPTEENAIAYHRGAIISFSIYGAVLAVVTVSVADLSYIALLAVGTLDVAVASITALALSSVTKRSGALILPALLSLGGVVLYKDLLGGAIVCMLLACVAVTLWHVGRRAANQQEEAEIVGLEARAHAKSVRAELDEYLAASEEWAFELDPDLNFTFVSQNYSEWTKIEGSHDALIGKSLPDVVNLLTAPDHPASESTKDLQRALRERRTVSSFILEIYSPTCKKRIFKAISARPILRGEQKVFAGYRGWAVEVTKSEEDRIALEVAKDELEEKVRERTAELEQARAAAVASESAKSQFLANMSHEIRSPMNGVLGMAQIIERDAWALADQTEPVVSGKAKTLAERARQISASGNSLVTVINDILDFSKIEAGRLDLHVAPFDVSGMLEDAAAMWSTSAAKKGLDLTLTIDPDAPIVVSGDTNRLRQILENIVGNAIKFTEAGSVEVAATATKDTAAQTIDIAITDTGPGIPPAERERIFERFDMVDASYTRKAGGTGLGLTIARQLTEMMGGKVWAEASDTGGACLRVRVTLPNASLQAADTVSATTLDRAVRRVLIVDDISVNQQILKAYHAPYDIAIETADNGQVAVEKARETVFDVIYMDIQMPVMDGYAACRAIRKREAEVGAPPAYIVLTSAHAFDEAIKEARDAGMDDAIVKPVRQEKIIALLGPAPKKGDAGTKRAAPSPTALEETG